MASAFGLGSSSGTGLGSMQARLIFSQHSKHCPPYCSTGNPVVSWEQGLPRNSVPLWEGGRRSVAAKYDYFFSVLGKRELLVPWVPGVFLFKDIGAVEINPSSFPST